VGSVGRDNSLAIFSLDEMKWYGMFFFFLLVFLFSKVKNKNKNNG